MLWFRPRVVIATGGFVSVPSVLAAALSGARSSSRSRTRGSAPRTGSSRSSRGESGSPSTGRSASARRRGRPRRLPGPQQDPGRRSSAARERYGIPEGQKVVFVVGGSMGSRSINRGIVEALKTLLDDRISVIHSTGLAATHDYRAFEDTCERLRQLGLSPDIPGKLRLPAVHRRHPGRLRARGPRRRAFGRRDDHGARRDRQARRC